ncbi:hypothetical protein [Streptomyces sp. NPDC090080]|uniref:hypothetical protein n=1 Tax=Streptomyces sp. NPDC090080 TaxID=3365939 RepID=UPI0038118603
MKITNFARKVGIPIAVASTLATTGILATATTASADVQKTLKLCAWGNYATFAEPSDGKGNMDFTQTVPAGAGCVTYGLPANDWVTVQIWGLWNNNPSQKFKVGNSFSFSSNNGWSGAAKGSTTAPYWIHFE